MKNICFHQLQPVQIVEGVDRTPHLLNLFFVKNLNWYARTLITTLTQLIRGRLESKTELHQDPKLDARNHGPNSIVSQKLEVIFKDCVSLKVLNKPPVCYESMQQFSLWCVQFDKILVHLTQITDSSGFLQFGLYLQSQTSVG